MADEFTDTGVKGPSKRTSNCLAMACGAVVVSGTLLAVGLYWATGYLKRKAADHTYAATEELLEEAPLEDLEREQILAEVARVRDGFREGELGLRSMGRFFRTLGEGPLLPLASVLAVQRLVLEPSELDFDEKVEGQIHLERVARGLYERSISPKEALRILKPIEGRSESEGEGQGEEHARGRTIRISSDDSGGKFEFQIEADNWSIHIDEHPEPEQVREMLRLAQETADGAEIPVEPFEVDLVDEVRRAVAVAFQ